MSAYRSIGDLVTIYEDPLTEKKAEGEAILFDFQGTIGEHEGREIEMWRVRYLSDPDQTFERMVLTPGNGGD